VENRNGSATPAAAGALVKQEFGATEMELRAETASTAAAAQAQAAVQARYIMALRRPRDLDEVRIRLLKECSRPGFAEVARYHKPVGKGVEGPSIRFAEAALRCMTNMLPETSTIYDDQRKRIIRVSVTDLEANVTYTKDIVIEKTVERSSVKQGQEVLRERMNSYGKKTYLVEATEDDLLNKEAALGSKALRGLSLRHLPGDIMDECMVKVISTLENKAAKDPDAERKKLVDAFDSIGVPVADLKTYLGHDLATCSPHELVSLRAVYAAIRDGEATWREALEHKTSKQEATAPPPPAAVVDAPAVQASPPAPASPTGQEEPELAAAFADPKSTAGALLKLINQLPDEGRKNHWRQRFNERANNVAKGA
jgi:hypothetical protein